MGCVASGSSVGLALAKNSWLGDGLRDARHTGVRCFQMAVVQRNPDAGLIVHSDRGTQQASSEHQALLKKYSLIGSMSRKDNCWDNAVMERVWQQDYASHCEAITHVAHYIVCFYNCIRLH